MAIRPRGWWDAGTGVYGSCIGSDTAGRLPVDVGVLVRSVRERVGGIFGATDYRRTKLAESGDPRANAPPVMAACGWDMDLAGTPAVLRE